MNDQRGMTLLESAMGALALVSILIAGVDGYFAFRTTGLIHDSAVETAEWYVRADQNLSGAEKEAFAIEKGYTFLSKTIPPTTNNCVGQKYCALISVQQLPLGDPNPNEIEVTVDYEIPLILLGSGPVKVTRRTKKHLESYYVKQDTAAYKNSNTCGSYGGTCSF